MTELHVIAFHGLLLHVVSCWREYCRGVARVTPWAYVRQDVPAWLAALIGTIIAVMLLRDVAAILTALQVTLGIRDALVNATRLLDLTAGYMGSSWEAKLPGIILPRISSPQQR